MKSRTNVLSGQSEAELKATLHERTDELAVSKRAVKKKVAQRKAAEAALRRRGEHYAKLLKASRSMQQSLRRLAHRALAAQENERGQISHELRDEMAQVLLAVNVGLLTLQQKAGADSQKLLKEIASTQSLLDQAVNTMRHVARAFRRPREK
jgi:signal transduction histidine kinase